MKRLLSFCLGIATLSGCAEKKELSAPLSLRWDMGCNGVDKDYYSNSFTLFNHTDSALKGDWAIYFNQLPRKIRQEENAPVKIEVVNADFFKMTPTEHFKELGANDSLVIEFLASAGLIKESLAPAGAYLVRQINGKESTPVNVPVSTTPFTEECQWSRPNMPEPPYPYGEIVYSEIENLKPVSLQVTDLIPSLKSVSTTTGIVTIGNSINISAPEAYRNEATLLAEKMQSLYGIKDSTDAPFNVRFEKLPADFNSANDEHYTLSITPGEAIIRGNTPHAIFNGTQTLLALLKKEGAKTTLPAMMISDYPDLPYRGQMIDISRNYIAKENLMKLIDLLASYKMNALHLHATDDEGWRIEIPGLEELTAVGGRRGHTTDESDRLKPSFGSGPDADDPTSLGNGFYTKEDFIEILQYAQKRHVDVIPEVDMPGHARAAIIAMKARYNKYKDTDLQKASEYLLHDAQDSSKYSSAQSYSDNVINVTMPSAYKFMDKVISEIAAMYHEAGVPLKALHIGGDEVPHGSWSGSPVAQEFMKNENIADARDLSNYFFRKTLEICNRYAIPMAGWQEIALDREEKVYPDFKGKIGDVYCWNTVPEWGGDVYPVNLANAGYDVILCNANNCYFDLSYNKHQGEPGLHWAGFVNEVNSFNLQPYSVYRSARTGMNGKPNDLKQIEAGKPRLTEEGKKHIKGVQGELWSENVLSYAQTEYSLFPKMYGLIERGWNAQPAWMLVSDPAQEQAAYQEALSHYYAKIGTHELPYLNRIGANFRLNQPGIVIKEGLLYANAIVPEAEIRYTLDGSVPTRHSTKWEKPVVIGKEVTNVRAKAFYLGKESLPTLLRVSQN